MALPGRDQTFAFESCRDVLLKLEREIDRYRVAVHVDDVEGMKDTAFNIAVTAWHLCDWVFNDMNAEQRTRLGIHEFGDMSKRALECRALHIFRQIATASKHWKVVKRRNDAVKAIVAAAPDWTIVFEDSRGRMTADEAFQQALSFWTEFIYPNGIPSD
jgi:hypothetical protein